MKLNPAMTYASTRVGNHHSGYMIIPAGLATGGKAPRVLRIGIIAQTQWREKDSKIPAPRKGRQALSKEGTTTGDTVQIHRILESVLKPLIH